MRERSRSQPLSEFMNYLATGTQYPDNRLPSLVEISQRLAISVARLREQLEVAKSLGLVEVRPKTGIRKLPYSFSPSVIQSLKYAVALDPTNFYAYSDLRNHLEATYWFEAVGLLTQEDHNYLKELIQRATDKLNGQPIQIPHHEHRELHLTIYRRLNNPFVLGLLEAYWEVYEAVGMDIYTEYDYLRRVWEYHKKMVDAVCAGDFSAGHRLLIDHMNLLLQRSGEIVS